MYIVMAIVYVMVKYVSHPVKSGTPSDIPVITYLSFLCILSLYTLDVEADRAQPSQRGKEIPLASISGTVYSTIVIQYSGCIDFVSAYSIAH